MIQKEHCFGCGVCVLVCPRNLIALKPDREGFLQPVIADPGACIQCGLCDRVCPDNDQPVKAAPLRTLAGWSEDAGVVKRSSSGGLAFELARQQLYAGYRVCGVRYDAEQGRPVHYIADCETDLAAMTGSKYLQSFTPDAFCRFREGDNFIVFGTQCQIDGVRHYLKLKNWEANFILVDLFCHGVPSLNLWKRYLADRGVSRHTFAAWRSKENNRWQDSYQIRVEAPAGGFCSNAKEGDLFFRYFLGSRCMGRACYRCKYRGMASAADIRLGDFWSDQFRDNADGVNAVVVYTEAGRRCIDSLTGCRLAEAERLAELKTRPWQDRPAEYEFILRRLAGNTTLEALERRLQWLWPYFAVRRRWQKLLRLCRPGKKCS